MNKGRAFGSLWRLETVGKDIVQFSELSHTNLLDWRGVYFDVLVCYMFWDQMGFPADILLAPFLMTELRAA